MTTALEITDFATAREQLRAGYEADSFVEAAQLLRISKTELANSLGLSPRNLQRKRTDGKPLSLHESERIYRVHRVWKAAQSLFEDEAIAEFLLTPDPALGDAPLRLLDTEAGADEVEGFIIGLAHGNFQ